MAIMGSIGLAILYGFKVNASVAIVAMVNHTAVKFTSQNLETDNITTTSANVCQFEDVSNVTKITSEVTIFYIRMKINTSAYVILTSRIKNLIFE